MAENIYNWQFNTIPGTANQGAVLMTRNDIGQPPFNQTDFIWKAMEDVFGVSNVRLDYDEEHNVYKIFKATGHLDNENNWSYNWEQFGEWEALTPEIVEALMELKYVSYRFDQTTVAGITTLKMYGKKKDGNEDLIVTITFVTKQYVDDALANIKEILAGTALEAVDSNNQRTLNLKYDENDFSVDANNKLKSELIKDNLNTSTIKTWSIDKIKDYVKIKWEYKGEVADATVLPDNANKGDVYGVMNEADMYVNISNTSTPSWKAFTEIAESFQTYAIELHKDTNGLYAKLRYDTVDFAIDQFSNLKSTLIDDTLDASSPLANRKVYSIDKILQLLSSMFVYKGQVDYYDLLPTTGNKVGDCWNVKYEGTSTQASTELDGDNYAWNGTSWDDLSGEYRAGAGIVINGKTISATGISFIVGDGLQATGAGSTQTLSTRITDGIQRVNVGTSANPVYADGVKAGSAIEVNANGVNVKTGYTTKTDSVTGNLEVDYANGLTQDTNNKLITNNGTGLTFGTNGKIDINSNFIIKDEPLGTGDSKLALYTDGKIGVDFTESPVVLSGELLATYIISGSANSISNVTIPNYNDYDMFYWQIHKLQGGVDVTLNGWYMSKVSGTFGKTNITDNGVTNHVPHGAFIIETLIENFNATTGNLSYLSNWYETNALPSGNWTAYPATLSDNNEHYVSIYGMRAR